MVEKKTTKNTTKKTTKRAARPTASRKTTKKKVSVHPKKTEVKTVVKTVPVKKEVCDEKNCCKGKKIMMVIICLLTLLNLVLAGLILSQKMNTNTNKILELGGEENYELFKEMTELDAYVDQQTQGIDQFVEGIQAEESAE